MKKKIMKLLGCLFLFGITVSGVIDLPILSNAEQCADMTMRIRSEYLFSQGRYSEIRFTDVNGKRLQYQGGGSRKALENPCFFFDGDESIL